MSDEYQKIIGGAVLNLAGDIPASIDVDRAALVRAWILHQLVDAAATVAAVIQSDPEGDRQ
jgi:hypothetical protein